MTGALKDGKRGPYEHEHQDPHAPKHTSPSSGTLRERDDPLLCPGVASSYLQPSVADRLFIGYTRCLSHMALTDGPASCWRPPGPCQVPHLLVEAPGCGGPALAGKWASKRWVGRQT